MPVPTVPVQFSILPEQLMQQVRRVAEIVNLVIRGRRNNSGTVTLTANAASTTLTDARIAFNSAIVLVPTTANAAAALGTTYISETGRLNGSGVISHANNAQTDRIFRFLIDG